MLFLNSLAFSMFQWMLAIWPLVPLPVLNPGWTLDVHCLHTIEAWLGEFWAFLCYCVRWECIDRWRLSYFFLLFFETLHSDAYIFPFLLCFSPLFFSQLFVRPPQTAILLFFAFLFHGDGLDPCLLYNVTNLIPYFMRHSIRSRPLNLFLTSTV